MPYIPHSEQDVKSMLKTLGVERIEDLFAEIPAALRAPEEMEGVPHGRSEMEVRRLVEGRAEQDPALTCFAGAGAYDHHIPAAIWEITTRGEFYSAYTPYQPEASQGTLQLLYEYQTMIAGLTGMDASNASLYDGASALGEAVLMAVRQLKGKRRRVLVPKSLHPYYRRVTEALVRNQQIELTEIPFDAETGQTDLAALKAEAGEDVAALVIPQPNYFGVLEEVDALADLAHERGWLGIGVVNPIGLGLLSPPGSWGEAGVEIVCGEGQPLGVPLSGGGPYFGFMACRQKYVRQLPGRIVGRTRDLDGREGFVLTLQAREQHIRRSKATSNICTNQGLTVTAATMYMAMMGGEGIRRVAAASHANTRSLVEALSRVPGVEPLFSGPIFHEAALRVPQAADGLVEALAAHGVLGGVDLTADYPELGAALLVCATEQRTAEEIEAYQMVLRQLIAGDRKGLGQTG